MLPSLIALSLLAALGASGPTVNVVYAGSLVTPMERTVGPAFAAVCGCEYRGEGKGSVALARLIAAGAKNPDVFISADTQVLDGLLGAPKPLIDWYAAFATARMVLGYSPHSKFAAQFDAVRAHKLSIAQLLETPGLRIGRTDPRLDPKGYRSVMTVQLLARHFHDPLLPAVLGAVDNGAQIFAEENLLVRLEEGDVDVAFLYSTESQSRRLPAIELPGDSNLGHPALARLYHDAAVRIGNVSYRGAPIVYALAIMNDAHNQAGAARFTRFILKEGGREMLEAAGLQFIAPQISGNAVSARRALPFLRH